MKYFPISDCIKLSNMVNIVFLQPRLVHSLLECLEHQSTRLTARVHTTLHTLAPDPLHNTTVDLQHFEYRCYIPDVPERDIGELAAPLCGNTYTVEKGGELVAEVLPEVEAEVGEFPDTFDTVDTTGFG